MAADEHVSLEGMEDIPDPVAYLAVRPAPAPIAPTAPSTTRPARERLGRLALIGAFAWVIVVTWSMGLRGDLLAATSAIPLALWTLLAGASLLLVLRPRARGLPAGVSALQAIVAAVPIAFVLLAAASTTGTGPVPPGRDVACLAATGGIAVAPFLLAAFALRRSFLSAPAWRGAAIGALCGLGGTIGVHAHCTVGDLTHVMMAHGLSIAVGAVLGAAASALQGRV